MPCRPVAGEVGDGSRGDERMRVDASVPGDLEDLVSTQQNLAWWQKLLVALKLWRPEHRTDHHVRKEMERPEMPPVTGAYGNRLVTAPRRRLVPQRGDDTPITSTMD